MSHRSHGSFTSHGGSAWGGSTNGGSASHHRGGGTTPSGSTTPSGGVTPRAGAPGTLRSFDVRSFAVSPPPDPMASANAGAFRSVMPCVDATAGSAAWTCSEPTIAMSPPEALLPKLELESATHIMHILGFVEHPPVAQPVALIQVPMGALVLHAPAEAEARGGAQPAADKHVRRATLH